VYRNAAQTQVALPLLAFFPTGEGCGMVWLSQVSLTNRQNDPLRYNWLRQQPIETEEGRMEYSTLEPWQEISETGVVYDLGSLYDRFRQIKDPRKAHGKRYSLVTLPSPIGRRTTPSSWRNCYS
jgi:hypothetical protein